MRKSSLAASVVLAVLAGVLLMPHATAQQDALLVQLQSDIQAATTVFVGVVRTAKPVRNETTGVVTTAVAFQPTVVLKGTRSADVLGTVLGGSVGRYEVIASRVPRQLTNGNRVLVFLDANGRLINGQTYRLKGAGNDSDTIEDTVVTLQTIRGLF